MITKNCEEETCRKSFNYTPNTNFPDKRKYCDSCSANKRAQWNANQQFKPIAQPEPVNPEVLKIGQPKPLTNVEVAKETGTFQSTVWNHQVGSNSYEVGQVGNRFKLYFETPAELKAKMQQLRDAGLMDLPLSKEVFE